MKKIFFIVFLFIYSLSFSQRKSQADSIWNTYPIYNRMITSTIEVELQKLDETHPDVYIGYMNLNKCWYELHCFRLREWGLNFWNEFPNDLRKYKWFKETVLYTPHYFKNIYSGFLERKQEDIDYDAMNKWSSIYPNMRKEFLNSKSVSRREKLEFIFSELESSMWSNINYPHTRGNRKFDLDEWGKKIQELTIMYTNFRDSVKESSPEILDFLKEGNKDLLMYFEMIFDHSYELGLDINELKAFCTRFKTSPHQLLQLTAARKEEYLKLTRQPFEFKHVALDGRMVDLSALRNKVVLLDFWSTFCTTCVKKMPEIKAVYEKYQKFGFEVVSICISPETKMDQILKINKKIDARWPVLQIGGKGPKLEGLGKSIFRKYGFSSVPRLMLLNQDGLLVADYSHLAKQGQLEKYVKELLKVSDFNSERAIYDKLSIDAKIEGLPKEKKLFLITAEDRQPDTISVVDSKDGRFNFNTQVPFGPRFHWIKIEGEQRYMTLFLENSEVIIRGDFKDWPNLKVNGSVRNDEFMEYVDEARLFKGTDRKQFNKEYIERNPNSFYAARLIARSKFNTEEMDKYYNQLHLSVRNSYYGKELFTLIDKKKTIDLVKVGNRLPDFTSLNSNNQKIDSKSIIEKSKLTFIDFWASWCVPCRKETPNLIKVYETFHKKGFNILSVSFDFKKNEWLDAINKDKMRWQHVSQLKGRDEDIGKILGISGIPAAILVDAEGKIIAIDAPGASIKSKGGSLRGEALYKKIEQLICSSDKKE